MARLFSKEDTNLASVRAMTTMAGYESEQTPLLRRNGSNGNCTDPHDRLYQDDLAIYQASVFVDDAISYRSIHHKIDLRSLKFYQVLYSWPIQLIISIAILVILLLPFFEYPTSINLSSDFRYNNTTFHFSEPYCGVIESIEFLCLLVFLANWIAWLRVYGVRRFVRRPWMVLYAVLVVLSFLDLFISLGFCFIVSERCVGATLRLRRFFRPFFFVVPSSIMKKFIKAVARTLVQIMSVLVLLVLHLYLFAMIGMLVFPRPLPPEIRQSDENGSTNASMWFGEDESNDTHSLNATIEGRKYFNSVEDSFISLLVFLTTANNPDVMTPIYMQNRFSFIYFFLFLLIGLYLILNLFTAAIYSEFRGYLEQSMQSSFFRHRVGFRAAFAVLARKHGGTYTTKDSVRQLLHKARIPKKRMPAMYTMLETIDGDHVTWSNFKDVFAILSKQQALPMEDPIFYSRKRPMELLQKVVGHKYFDYFTVIMSLLHVLVLTLEMEVDYTSVARHSNSFLAYINFFFFMYYSFEQAVKMVGLGLKRYFKSITNIFDLIITCSIFIMEVAILIMYGVPFGGREFEPSGYFLSIRIMNLLIVLRLLRIISLFRSVSIVFGTMVEILKNLRAFAGIIVVIYYLFALLGMALFGENYRLEANSTRTITCGKYENLQYYAYNFHDFAAALVLLWNVMVVNNWYVFLDAFSYAATTKWAQLYFISWWLVSVIITVNVFVSLVIEVFVTRWEAYNVRQRRDTTTSDDQFQLNQDVVNSLHINRTSSLVIGSDIRLILQKNLTEPSESSLAHEIHRHKDLL